jgi:hypothetical protein
MLSFMVTYSKTYFYLEVYLFSYAVLLKGTVHYYILYL